MTVLMPGGDYPAGRRYNFRQVQVLVVDPVRSAGRLMGHLLSSFGAEDPLLVTSTFEAQDLLGFGVVHAAIIAMDRRPQPALELVRRIRRLEESAERVMPVIMIAGYSNRAEVSLARDAGASCVLRRPVSPRTLLLRLAWAAQSDRAFIAVPSYCGPDRRHRRDGPPPEGERRTVPVMLAS